MALGAWLVFLMVLLAGPAGAEAEPYPVRNGSFERAGGWELPQHWRWHAEAAGDHRYLYNWQAPAGERYVQVENGSGLARVYQVGIPVLAGSYRLTLRAKGTTTGHVLVAGPGGSATLNTLPSETWQDYELKLDVPQAGEVGIYLHALPAGAACFDDVSLEPVRMRSGAIPTDGVPLGAVVLPEGPTPAERFAAYELQRCLHAMTGVHLALDGRDETMPGRRVVLGRAALGKGLAPRRLKAEEAYAVVVRPGAVYLAGRSDRGTLYAAYHFLGLLGCRWVLPGDAGEVIPRHSRLALPACSRYEAPDYAVRGIMVPWADFLPPGGHIPADMDAHLDWALRNRLNAVWWGGGDTEPFLAHRGHGHEQVVSHSYRRWVPGGLAEHPDWFPLVVGKRLDLHTSGRSNQLCVSNKQMRADVARRIIEYFDAYPRARAAALNAEDEPCFWCECPACKALDARPSDWSGNGRELLAMTDRVVHFVNDVAARVARRYPDRLIEMYAYGSTTEPPVRERCHRNVLVKYCLWPPCARHDLLNPKCERNRKVAGQLRAWKKRSTHLAVYHYGDYRYTETPACWYGLTAAQFRALRKIGAEHVLGESANSVMGSALWYFLLARVLWDTDTDAQAVVRDYCAAAYGPAAAPMGEYYGTLEKAFHADVERAGEKNETANNLGQYTPEVVARAKDALARAAAGAGTDDSIQARIDRARFSLLYAEVCRVADVGPHTEEAYASGRRSFDALKEVQARRGICSGSVIAVARLKGFYVPPLRAQQGELLLAFPITWKFRKDPDDAGEKQGWDAAEPDGRWSDVRTDASWTDQGHTYHGTAWYTTTVAVPGFAAGTKPWLLFGAVDGDCWVWVDGKPAGKQTEDVVLMWDKPFALDVTGLIRPGGTHRITVKVRKDSAAAGIWRPVELRLDRGT